MTERMVSTRELQNKGLTRKEAVKFHNEVGEKIKGENDLHLDYQVRMKVREILGRREIGKKQRK